MCCAWQSSAWEVHRQGGVCGIQGTACLWEVLQGVGLAPLSLVGKWDVGHWDVTCWQSCEQNSLWLWVQVCLAVQTLLLGSSEPCVLPARSPEHVPSSLQSSRRGCQEGNATLISSSVSPLFPSARVMSFICLPALPLGLLGSAEAPGFPFRSTSAPCTFCFLCRSRSLSVCRGIPLPVPVPVSSLLPVP